ncbi:uncharacterized protein LOC116681927, partial [Etheostoma spectabile]|uniref:uncharacterized protein LOC116681927 n=1 Tax=Etheostoma spectabile TaxID=54343 RepID=UPI0013AF3230
MVTETLRCTVCSLNYLSTSQTVRNQLDLPHQKVFRLILTHKYACDIRVNCVLRDRTLGNSPARLVKQLRENHGEEWLNRLAHYLGECADFVDRPSLFPVVCQEPPEPIDVPTSRWQGRPLPLGPYQGQHHLHIWLYLKDGLNQTDHKEAGWPRQVDWSPGHLYWKRDWPDRDQCGHSAGGARTGEDGGRGDGAVPLVSYCTPTAA